MKYIRTKDGEVFDTTILDKYHSLDTKFAIIDNYLIVFDKIHKNCVANHGEVLKQSDTIEELCDGLIVEEKNNTNNWFVMEISEYQSTDNADIKYMVHGWNFNAFIKTEKGLIYVAKLNEKGDLELL